MYQKKRKKRKEHHIYYEGQNQMAEKLDPKELVKFKELLMSEVIQSEALINLLDRKNIISKKELLEEMKRIHIEISKPST